MRNWTQTWWVAAFFAVPVFSLFLLLAPRLGQGFQDWLAAVMFGFSSLFIFAAPFTNLARKSKVRFDFIVMGVGGYMVAYGAMFGAGRLVGFGTVVVLAALAKMGRAGTKVLKGDN